MNKRHYEHTLPNIRGSLSNTYLRKEFHERIQKIVQTIGNNEMSIFSYVDNVLEQHFATYQDEITKEYRKRSTELF